MKKIYFYGLFVFVILSHSPKIWSQAALKKIIEQTDEIYDSQVAFDKLDSLFKNANIQAETKINLLQKLVQRSLEINDYKQLSAFSIEGVELARTLKKDSVQAHFYKALGISQVYSQKPEQAIETWKKKC